MSRLTRLCCSVWGMVFLITGLLVGIWSEVDPLELFQRAVLSGLAGLVCGYVVGRLLTILFKEWMSDVKQNLSSEVPQNSEEKSGEGPKLQPWNPPKISKEDQGR